MLSEANFLILDEPTNHLDITSKEILEQALTHYTGTVLYVSHDRYFINKTATRILDLKLKTLINYIGNYDYYLEKKDILEQAAAQARPRLADDPAFPDSPHPARPVSDAGKADAPAPRPAAPAGKTDWKQQKEEQAKIRKRQNELKKTEEEIHALETRGQEIDALLSEESVYLNPSRLIELNQEKERLTETLETLYEKWEELAQ